MSENVLNRALLTVSDRGKDYGDVRKGWSRVAKIWSAILGIDITPEQALLCMQGLKISRLSDQPNHEDSNLDIAGYAWCYEQLITGEKDENKKEHGNISNEKGKGTGGGFCPDCKGDWNYGRGHSKCRLIPNGIIPTGL
jgi:hypothetical protein